MSGKSIYGKPLMKYKVDALLAVGYNRTVSKAFFIFREDLSMGVSGWNLQRR
jgi:hypothetical protein